MVQPQDFLVSWIHARKKEELRKTGRFRRKQLEVPIHADGQRLGRGQICCPILDNLGFICLLEIQVGTLSMQVERSLGWK